MSFKKALLSSVVLASVAQGALAATLTNVSLAGGVNLGTGTYTLASEFTFATTGQMGTLFVDLTANNTLPAANIVMNVSLTGAVLAAAPSATAVTTNNVFPTANLLTGSAGQTSATFFFANPVGTDGVGSNEGYRLEIPFRASQAAVSVTGGFTVNGIDADGGTSSRQISVGRDVYSGALASATPARLSIASGFRSGSGGNITIGNAAVVTAAGGPVYKNFAGVLTTGTADVSAAVVTVTGNFENFGTSGSTTARLRVAGVDAALTPAAAGTATVTLTGTAAGLVTNAATNGAAIVIVPGSAQAGALTGGAYNGTIQLFYNTPLVTSEPVSASVALGTVQREGTTLLFPWTASSTTAAISGSTNLIRLSNSSASPMVVRARVLATSSSSFVAPSQLVTIDSIPARGELVLTSASLTTALGDFARGDIELVVEGAASSITARRLVQRPDGVFEWRQGAGTDADAQTQ